MPSIRVVLADDHTLVRAGLRLLIEKLAGVHVVAEANDGREVLPLIHAHQPDIVLMDIAMPEMNGLEATARVVRDFPHVRVLILSMHASEEYVVQALHAGASGYLLKNAAADELELAIRAVARGEAYLSPLVSKQVISSYLQHVRNGQVQDIDIPDSYQRLTARQREILQLVAEGRTTKEIAQRLQISIKTVETHRTELMRRLDIHEVAGLVRYAIRMGLLTSDT